MTNEQIKEQMVQAVKVRAMGGKLEFEREYADNYYGVSVGSDGNVSGTAYAKEVVPNKVEFLSMVDLAYLLEQGKYIPFTLDKEKEE